MGSRGRCWLVLGAALCAGAAEEPLSAVHRDLDELLGARDGLPEPPTVVLAGHHNDGKSALLEALIGVRLSQPGSSTTTRRPLRVHSQYDAACDEPTFYLTRDDGSCEEDRVTAKEVRAFVEAENARLARAGAIEGAEIRVRMRWRSAPSLVLVDTPGLLSLPEQSSVADEALAGASAEAERVLLAQLAEPNRLVLCLEDTSDWALSPTRTVVRRADPALCRTILVNPKLDAKLAQFAQPEDLHRLLSPREVRSAHPQLLGGPIFTSVPPLRDTKPSALASALREQEATLKGLLAERLDGDETHAERVGIEALRAELQTHVDARWEGLLGAACKAADARVGALQRQLQSPPGVEAEDLDDFVHRYCLAVHALLRGSIALDAASAGETLEQEQAGSGSGALCPVRRPAAHLRKAASDADAAAGLGGQTAALAAAAASAAADAAAEPTEEERAKLWVHAGKRLYGGAQYWRALQEFMLGAAQPPDEEVTAEEIINAMGVDGYHDGVNYMRAVCVIVVEKARGYFDGSLGKLRLRLLHVMARLAPLADEMMARELGENRPLSVGAVAPSSAAVQAEYMQAVTPVYQRFVSETMDQCMAKCEADVAAMTKYVSWDFNSPSKDALHNLLVEPIQSALTSRFEKAQQARLAQAKGRGRRRRRADDDDEEPPLPGAEFASYDDLIGSFTEVLMTRRVTEPMRALMNDLVIEIIRAWREEFCRAISLKLNACYLMPFCEVLPNYMRKEVARYAAESGLGLGLTGAGPPRADEVAAQLRVEINEGFSQQAALQAIATRMRARGGLRGSALVGAGNKGK